MNFCNGFIGKFIYGVLMVTIGIFVMVSIWNL